MNIYEARWNNARKIMDKINSCLDAGCLIFDEDGDLIKQRFEIKMHHPFETITCQNVCYFINSTSLDNGMYTTIKEFNSKFKMWKIVHPKHIVSLI